MDVGTTCINRAGWSAVQLLANASGCDQADAAADPKMHATCLADKSPLESAPDHIGYIGSSSSVYMTRRSMIVTIMAYSDAVDIPSEGGAGFAAGLGESHLKGFMTDARRPVLCSGTFASACTPHAWNGCSQYWQMPCKLP